MRNPAAAAALAAAVLLAFGPSLGGGWVWDDNYLMTSEAAQADLTRFLTMDEWDAAGLEPAQVYRPLRWLTALPGMALIGGPTVERFTSLALHGGVVWLIWLLASALGARREAAWMGAAAFALHPVTMESVAWIQARPELLLSVLVLGGLLAFLKDRPLLAGALFALAPFVKEVAILTPLAVAPVLLAHRPRGAALPLGLAAAGSAAYLALRSALAIPTPASDLASNDLVGAAGGIAAHGLRAVLGSPGASTPFDPYVAHPLLGIVGCLLVAALCTRVRGRPRVGLVLASAILLAPSGAAAASNGIFGDRYLYAPLAMLVVAGAPSLNPERFRLVRGLWALPALFGLVTFLLVSRWTSDASLARAAIRERPDNPHAAFHLAHELHTGQGDCASAIPLYEQAVAIEPRAQTNLVGCLLDEGRSAEAARRGMQLMTPDSPAGLAFNTARALATEKAWPQAELATRQALKRDPEHVKAMVFLGEILLLGQQPDEARHWFDQALAREPDHAQATRRLRELQMP